MSSKRKNPPSKTVSGPLVAAVSQEEIECERSSDRKVMKQQNNKSGLLLSDYMDWENVGSRVPPLKLEDLGSPNRDTMTSSEYAERIIAQSRIILNNKKTMEDVLKRLSSQLNSSPDNNNRRVYKLD